MIEKIRVSVGSASVLGLDFRSKFKDLPTTCYIMTFKEGHCLANCGFCPQARSSESSIEKLSRISWPLFSFKDFLRKLKELPSAKKFMRICIQTLNYPENFNDLKYIITEIKQISKIPISVAIPPMSREKIIDLKKLDVQRIGIALDGANPEIFKKIKGSEVEGPYTWEGHFQKLKEALEIFSKGSVSTHLIIGLGETEKDVIKRIEEFDNLGILISLFAFTPIKGTKFENLTQPQLQSFRKLQLGRYLIVNLGKPLKDFKFNTRGELLNIKINRREFKNIIYNTEAFYTSGCPGCNRPYYTSKPSGSIYNYPRKLNELEKKDIYDMLKEFVN